MPAETGPPMISASSVPILPAAPLVSVMLPVYNGAATLALAVQSIVWQTFENWELILLDDGSTDGSVAIASTFNDPRIRIVADGGWKGLAGRLNEAIDNARGRYLARMDQDDVAFPERLVRQVEYLDSHPEVDLLATRAIAFRGDGEPIGLLPFSARHADICRRPWNNFPMPHPTWLGRAEWFRRHRYFMPEVVRAEDQDLLLRAYPVSRYACIPDVLLGYRQGPYSVQKTLFARRQLARAQLRAHSEAGRIGFAALAALTWAVKSGVDLLAAVPGLDGLFFARMAGDVPTDARDRWSEVWERVNQEVGSQTGNLAPHGASG